MDVLNHKECKNQEIKEEPTKVIEKKNSRISKCCVKWWFMNDNKKYFIIRYTSKYGKIQLMNKNEIYKNFYHISNYQYWVTRFFLLFV